MKIEINKEVFDQFPELESRRLKYRQMRAADSQALFAIRSSMEVMKYMGREEMKCIAESEHLITSIAKSFQLGAAISWAIIEKSTNVFIGYFGYWRIEAHHCRGEIGYALDPNYWRKGYMKETACELIKYGFNKIRLHSIEANVDPNNLPSIKLLERLGFRKEAYFRENFLFRGEFVDSAVYSLLERDFIRN